MGEYERTIACVLNAYVKARMGGYLAQVEGYLQQRLPGTKLFITRSNGGAMAAAEARSYPIHTLLSGPASGVTAARSHAAATPEARLLTLDMGGTSTDMSLILGGRPTITNDAAVGDFPLTMPVTGIEAVGAGGGSIAWMDGRVLRVGPSSAGAWPGPACFGRGGKQPTVTDAYLVCGFVDSENFLGGRMKLDPVAARAAFEPLAAQLGASVAAVAEACITVATSNMVAKALPYLARHGVDQEELTLVLFGGAGSLHGPLLAHELGIRRMVVPRTPSVFCAFGGLVSQLVQDTVATVYGTDPSRPELARRIAELEARARDWLAAQVPASELVGVQVEYWAEMRYLGQFFSMDIFLPAEAARSGNLSAVHAAFHEEYERLYSQADRGNEVELLELRVRIAGALPSPDMGALPPDATTAAPPTRRTIRFEGETWPDVPVHARSALPPRMPLRGPALIEQENTTIFVPPGYKAEAQPSGDILMAREA
jgi:N-methylhydantoinase A